MRHKEARMQQVLNSLVLAKTAIEESIKLVKSEMRDKQPTLPDIKHDTRYIVVVVRGDALMGVEGGGDHYNYTKSKPHHDRVEEILEDGGWLTDHYEIVQLGYEDITIIPRAAINATLIAECISHWVNCADEAPDGEWPHNVDVHGMTAEELFHILPPDLPSSCGGNEVTEDMFVQDDVDQNLGAITGVKSWS
jgi:hypothetical protein